MKMKFIAPSARISIIKRLSSKSRRQISGYVVFYQESPSIYLIGIHATTRLDLILRLETRKHRTIRKSNDKFIEKRVQLCGKVFV